MQSPDNAKIIYKNKFGNILMHLKESKFHRQYNTTKVVDTLKMSDISAYTFCPVSAVILKTLLTK